MNKISVWLLTSMLLMGAALPAHSEVSVNVDLGFGSPVPRVEMVPVPRSGYVWAPGYWSWNGRGYLWVPGHWIAARPGYIWTPDHWERINGRSRYLRGNWARHDERREDRRENRNRHDDRGGRDRD